MSRPETFEEFWTVLSRGGVSPQGDRYSVTPDGRLHILSPRNTNESYYISREKAEQYLAHDIPSMTPAEFRYRRSAYFHNIYLGIIHG